MRRFLRTFLVVLLFMVAAVALLVILGGDQGSLPFLYEGFG